MVIKGSMVKKSRLDLLKIITQEQVFYNYSKVFTIFLFIGILFGSIVQFSYAVDVIDEVLVGDNPVAISVNPNTNLIYVANNGDGTISVIDGNNTNMVTTFSVGDGLSSISVNPTTNMIYVTSRTFNAVSVIDGNTNTVLGSIISGYKPTAISVNPNTNLIYVVNNGDDTVSVIDGVTNTVVDEVSVSPGPEAISVNPNTNLIYVASFLNNIVSVIDGNTNTVIDEVLVGDGLVYNGLVAINVNPTTNMIYVTDFNDETVLVIDGNTNTVIDEVLVGDNPQDVDMNPNTNLIYVASFLNNIVSVIDGNTNTVIDEVLVGDNPVAISVNPNTNLIYVANNGDGTVSVIDGNTKDNPPTNLIAISGENTKVQLTWNAPADDGGSLIIDYKVEFSDDGGVTWNTFDDGISITTSSIVTSLVNDTPYDFRVSAINGIGTGPMSSIASATPASATPAATIPSDPPTNLIAISGENTKVQLIWNAPADDGGSLIIDYKVEFSDDGGVTWNTFDDGISITTSSIVTGLVNDTPYDFRVSAINGIGTGPESATAITPTDSTTFQSFTNSGLVTISTTKGTFSSVESINELYLPTDDKPSSVSFPYGLFSWTVIGLINESSIDILLTFPSAVPINSQFWKVMDGDTWINASSVLSSNDGDNTIIITITDGGDFDADGEVNGEIADLGGIAISIVVTNDDDEDNTGGVGNANKHKTRPTFGIDHKTNIQKIKGGFSFNDKLFDITHNFWTPFEQQTIKIGESNSFSAKVFAEYDLRVQEFLFGIPKVGDAHKAELRIEIFYDYNGEIEKIQEIQRTNIINRNTLTVEGYPSKCLPDETEEKCVTTLILIEFLEPLKDSLMAIKAIDYKNRVTITYLNDGFDISGDSLNPMKTVQIPGPEKYEGLITVTQAAKYSDVWLADDGRVFERNESGTFYLINESFERLVDTGKTMMKRNHSEFYKLVNYEINRAVQNLFEQLCKRCSDEPYAEINDIFAYDYPTTIPKNENSKIQATLIAENLKAQQILNKK